MSYGLCVSTGSYLGGGVSGSGYGNGYNKTVTSANIRTMSRNTGAGYEQQMHIIEKYIKQGDIDKALVKYNNLFDEIKASNSYGNKVIDDYQVASIMANAYESATGVELADALDKKTTSPLLSGILQGIPLIGLFCEDTTSAEAYAKLDNEKTSFKDKGLEYGGAMASGAAVGAAIGGFCGAGVFSWATAGIGAAIGAGVGALQTFLKDIL